MEQVRKEGGDTQRKNNLISFDNYNLPFISDVLFMISLILLSLGKSKVLPLFRK